MCIMHIFEKEWHMYRILIITSLVALSACATDLQLTSGRAFLDTATISDPDLVKAARYEPRLEFPARIGLVRLVYGGIEPMPHAERALYAKAFDAGFGTIVHLGSLEAQYVGQTPRKGKWSDLKKLQVLAASRHLDYILLISYLPGRNLAEALFLDTRSGYPYASADVSLPGRAKTNFWGNRLKSQARQNRATLDLAEHLAPEIEKMAENLARAAK